MPAGTTARTTGLGTGSGKVSGVLGDSGDDVATGTAAARSATTSVAASRSIMFSIVVAAGDEPEPTDEPPVAEFTALQRTDLRVRRHDSRDADGDDLTYAWNFGDTGTGTGATTEHTYASDGPRTVTLTVSDGTAQDQATRQVDPRATVAQGTLAFVGAASTAGNRNGHTVRIPDAVKPNDRLLLFMTTNTTTGTITDALPGWTLLQSRDGNGIRGRAWTRRATGGDPGSEVSVSASVLTKSTLSVAAYRSTGSSMVSASAVRGVDSSTTSLATPTAPSPRPPRGW